LLRTHGVEKAVIESVPRYLDALRRLEVSPPIVLMLTLRGVRDASIPVSAGDYVCRAFPVRHDVLPLPEVMLHDYQDALGRVLRPVFDALPSGRPADAPDRLTTTRRATGRPSGERPCSPPGSGRLIMNEPSLKDQDS